MDTKSITKLLLFQLLSTFKLKKKTLSFTILTYKICDISEYYYIMFVLLIISGCDLRNYHKSVKGHKEVAT